MKGKATILEMQNRVAKRRWRFPKKQTLGHRKDPKYLCPGCGRGNPDLQQHSSQCVNERNFKVLFARVVLRCGVMDVSAVLCPFDEYHDQQSSYTWHPHEDPFNLLAINGLKVGSMSALGWVMHIGKALPMFKKLYDQLDSYFRSQYPPPIARSQSISSRVVLGSGTVMMMTHSQ
jgi:hypothetical protein